MFWRLYRGQYCANHLLFVPGFLAVTQLILGSRLLDVYQAALLWFYLPKYKLVEEGEMTFTSLALG